MSHRSRVGRGGRALEPRRRPSGHGAAVWGNALMMLPTLDVAPPVTMWSANEIAIDVFHHAVYAAGTGVAYELPNGRR